MRPLASHLTSFSDFTDLMPTNLSDGHVIGFLLDSRYGELKKSGLLLHPDCVLPLDELLGQRATLFYPDPRKRQYLEAVQDFGSMISGSEKVRFEITPPALVLITFLDGLFEKTKVLTLDQRTMCLWHAQIYAFIEDYLGNQLSDSKHAQGWRRLVETHAGTIGMESLKAGVSVLFSKLMLT
jgi:hypothetical protein